ncbi:hypothetical protein [Nonomuraea zeae]|uniref:DUF8094 domain-containing protein n=1 Tax=Nonomuraea zeae TaxID=1642303 RepID=A0A5S4GSM6_9ACTN|nr:hypothetical protein [Nonomuraea zeae]TMR35494.1 hypothetical protein ETD85_13820 [Nonomuraea zeae]
MTIRRPSLMLATGLSLTVLPACNAAGGGGQFAAAGRPSPAARPAGVVTVAEARKLLTTWDGEVKKAQRDGGTDYSGTHAGLASELTEADSRVTKALGDPIETSHATIVKPRFAIPAKGAADPPWFMAEFSRKGGKGWTQVIFQQTPGGWRQVAWSETTAKPRIPAPARDGNGLATVLAPDGRSGLPASPRQIVQAHMRMESTFGKDPRARRLFTADAKPRENAANYVRLQQQMRGQWNVKVATKGTQELFALKTAAGGALVWYGTRNRLTFTARPGAGELNFTDRPAAATSHGKRYTRKAVLTSGATYLAIVPRSGKVRVPVRLSAVFTATGS